jgi:hypothetical protein
MNNVSRDRSHPDHKLEQQILKTEVCYSVVNDIQELVVQYASEFDFDFLSFNNNIPSYHLIPLLDAIAELYNKTRLKFKKNKIDFDNHWVKT